MRFPRQIFFAGLLLFALLACGRRTGPEHAGAVAGDGSRLPKAIPVRVLADSGASTSLDVRTPAAGLPPGGSRPAAPREGPRHSAETPGAWLVRVSPAVDLVPPLPEAAPDTATPSAPGPLPGPPSDDRLAPPIPRAIAMLRVPRGAAGASVELDVLVNTQGFVVQTRWVGGAADSARVRAATECAEAMTFTPAMWRGRPVEVWCRQRFDFGR